MFAQEAQAGLPADKIVAAHGNFDSAHCIGCRREHTTEHVRSSVMAGEVCRCDDCGGLVKPDIVFFGMDCPITCGISPLCLHAGRHN